MTPSQRVLSAVAASLLVHVGAAWLIPRLGAPAFTRAASTAAVLAPLPFEVMGALVDSLPAALRYPSPAPLTPGGPVSRSSLDTAEDEQRGGTGAAPEDTLRLFPFLSTVQLQDTDLNQLEMSQAQRIQTAKDRSTLEQRRATPHAADAVFLASGSSGGHQERRVPSPADARAGGLREVVEGGPRAGEQRTAANEHGVALPGETRPRSYADEDGEASPQPSTEANGGPREAVTQGIARGRGERAKSAARVAFARPNVDQGPAATPAVDEDVRVRDDVDAELLAARLQRSLVDASLQRSTARAPGLGGEIEGPGLAPSGSDRGAKATPYLPGAGRLGVLDTRDARYLRWFTNQRARVQQRLVFPEQRALAKDQGVSLYRVDVRRDGSLRGAPLLLRSSGHSDFDAAASTAIERAAPFEPLPAALAPELPLLSLVIPVEFDNPMVQ